MEEHRSNENVLILQDELILDTESGGENALASEPGVLLLNNEMPPEPVIRKIDVGPRVSAISSDETAGERGIRADLAKVWQRSQPAPPAASLLESDALPLAAAMPGATGRSAGVAELVYSLAEARAFADNYGAMKARTRKALYEALGRTYDFTIRAEAQPEEFARLIAEAGLTVQDRAPFSPIVKLVFGADYDKTRVAEFAAAIAYGRRKHLPVGSFTAFLDRNEGGLKAVIGLERLFRSSKPGADEDGPRAEARPAIARKLREILPTAWNDLSAQGDEFALLLARRLPDGSIAMVGEVPRDIAMLEKAARRLLAEVGRAGDGQSDPAENHPEEV